MGHGDRHDDVDGMDYKAFRNQETEKPASGSSKARRESDESPDELIRELEREVTLENDCSSYINSDGSIASVPSLSAREAEYRATRLQELKSEFAKIQSRSLAHNDYFGKVSIVHDEKEVLRVAVLDGSLVLHFFQPNFIKCATMTEHLQRLAHLHTETRFIECLAEKMNFLVDRLAVKVLPCVILFRNGITVDRIVGFEGLGGDGSSFSTRTLEWRLKRAGVIDKCMLPRGCGGGRESSDSNNDDFDNDDY